VRYKAAFHQAEEIGTVSGAYNVGAHHHNDGCVFFPRRQNPAGKQVNSGMLKRRLVAVGVEHHGKVKVVDTVIQGQRPQP
jgi:hypothetical protein